MKKFLIPICFLFIIVIALPSNAVRAGSKDEELILDVTPLERYIYDPWKGDLDGMRDRRVIRVLVVYNRILFYYEGMRPMGTNVEAVREFETLINKRFKTGNLKINAVFIPLPRDRLLPALAEGRGDIAMGNLTITPERQRIVDFTTPVMEDISELVVTSPQAPAIATVDDLAGRAVYVRKSSSYYEHLQKQNSSFKRKGKPQVIIIPADENLEDDDILEMVNAGIVDMTIVDSHTAKFWDKLLDQIAVHYDVSINSGGKLGWAFRKNSPQLKAVLNEYIPTHKVGTSFGSTVLSKYLENTKLMKRSTSKGEMAKFESLKEIFKKYADIYDMDWLLLAAQGYQESGLNQNARSRRGAVGIMQVLPSTAASSPVNIPNISTPENNVHAGTKLLKYFIDEYFNEKGLDPFNRALMSVASYNAGPARISSLRKKAAARGLDPDRWFDNVEILVGESIGMETVQYVSNVFKYYLAYKMAMERMETQDRAESKEKKRMKKD